MARDALEYGSSIDRESDWEPEAWAAINRLKASRAGAILPERVTDEMVERAAEALWRVVAMKDLGHQRPYPYDGLIPATQRDLVDYARAALEAALHPSQPAGEGE